jgi:hypothetical protein
MLLAAVIVFVSWAVVVNVWQVAVGRTAVPIAAATDACGVIVVCSNDPTVTSALEVDHLVSGSSTQVEPQSAEVWSITARYNTDAAGYANDNGRCDCTHIPVLDSSVVATVTWGAGGWSVSCPACGSATSAINAVSVCPIGGCNAGATEHAYKYKLIADVKDAFVLPDPPVDLGTVEDCTRGNFSAILALLTTVDYALTSSGQGKTVNTGNCTLGSTVTQTTGPSSSDTGTFECSFSCTATGPSVAVTYN